jgi:hypothetical protein
MSLSRRQKVTLDRSAVPGGWFSQFFTRRAQRDAETTLPAHPDEDDTEVFDGFHWPNRKAPLTKSELQIMAFWALEM